MEIVEVTETFKVYSLDAFALLKMSKKSFYEYLNEEYYNQINIRIDIKEVEVKFIKDGLKINILEFEHLL